MLPIGIIDHVEGPADQPSKEIYEQVCDLTRLADELGVRYAWFSEHHAHVHEGHLPAPLFLALHLAGVTRQIHLGTAIICLGLHHPLDIAEQIAVADTLSGGRIAAGFGSGCTPEESELYGVETVGEEARHAQCEQSLRTIFAAWNGSLPIKGSRLLPAPSPDLPSRCWLAANSIAAAKIAGLLNFNILFSHLRTLDQYREMIAAYRAAGGSRLIAANRPVFVGPDDQTAMQIAEPALRKLWQRFRAEGKISADTPEPTNPLDLCGRPINFLIGGPQTVANQIRELRSQVEFDLLNIEIRWEGLPHAAIRQSLERFMRETVPGI